MANRNSRGLKNLVQPYVFVLKEGTEIKEDYMDYSLLMLQVNCHETLRSPKPSRTFPPAVRLQPKQKSTSRAKKDFLPPAV